MARTTSPEPAGMPVWVNGKNIEEDIFCAEFRRAYPILSSGGSFFTVDGRISDESVLEKRIFDCIVPYIHTAIYKKVRSIVETLRVFVQVEQAEDFPAHRDRIHVANGTFFIPAPGHELFRPEKEICRNRLPVAYNPDAPEPVVWKKFLAGLLNEEDIPTLQEFMGYCLLPTTKAQKMLLIVGKGGEGKSRIGLVLRSLLGKNMNVGSISKLENNRFARADLEHRLLLLDDDMTMGGLASTECLKAIVTAETDMDLEKKGKQSYQGTVYARLMGFGNGSLHALYDRSQGFFRRQIVLKTKEFDLSRKNDPFLAEKMCAESEGIFLWCLEGLRRLMKNNYNFTLSTAACRNLNESIREGNNIIEFLASTGYIRQNPEGSAASRELYGVYKGWCEDNMTIPVTPRSFLGYLKEEQRTLGIYYDNNVAMANGKRARGFHGIECARLGQFEPPAKQVKPEPESVKPVKPNPAEVKTEPVKQEPVPEPPSYMEVPPIPDEAPPEFAYMG